MPNRENSRRPKKNLFSGLEKSLDELKESVSSMLDEDTIQEKFDSRVKKELSDCQKALDFAKGKLHSFNTDSRGERPRRRRPNDNYDNDDYGMNERPRRRRPNDDYDNNDHGMDERPRRPRRPGPNDYNDNDRR